LNQQGEQFTCFPEVFMGRPQLSAFQIDVRADGHGLLMVFGGELDMDAVPRLQGSLNGVIESTSGAVLVDLADVTFVDSSAISELLKARQTLLDQGRVLRVTGMSTIVARVFELTGLTDVFRGLDEAVR
jgi:anti-sigma B factor antagonist